MKTGIIETYNIDRGYGFIQIANGRKIFFHIRNWRSDETPTVGMSVIFEVGPGHLPGKPEQAINVSLLDVSVGADASQQDGGVL